MYETYEYLTIAVNDGVALITMTRPETLNAWQHAQMAAELVEIWEDLERDPDVEVSVLSGANERGLSLRDAACNTSFGIEIEGPQMAHELVFNILNFKKPLIVAISGTAVGAGLTVAMMADFRIMAENARLMDGRTALGGCDPADELLPALCRMTRSKYYPLASNLIDGRAAERFGLVDKVTPSSRLMPETLLLARGLAAESQLALRSAKTALSEWLRLGSLAAFDLSLALEMVDYFSRDFREGLRAFAAKEQPSFPRSPGHR